MRIVSPGATGMVLVSGNSCSSLLSARLMNTYSIYLHDTPAKAAFNQPQRSVSHGCVRLEKAIDLAKLLLNRELGWPPEKVDEALDGHETESVALPQKIPVEVFYWTAFVQGNQVSFRDDIYGWDQELLRLLDAGSGSRA